MEASFDASLLRSRPSTSEGKQGGDPAGYQVAHFGEAGGTAGRRAVFTRSRTV
jgi:hypothetical protein